MSSKLPSSNPIPIIPDTREELFSRHGVVAVLVPNTLDAIQGFSGLIDQILLTPVMHKELLSQPCLFLFNEEKRSLDDILDTGATPFLTVQNRQANDHNAAESDDVANASDTTCGSTYTNTSNQLWHGFVGLSLRKLPQTTIFGGWSVGFQPMLYDYAPSGRCPDIPICSERAGREARIHRHHILISFTRGTAILGIKTVKDDSRTKCDAEPVTKRVQQPLVNPTQLLQFGTLHYWMIYVRLQAPIDNVRRQELADFINNMPGGTALRSASATPTDNDTIVGMWRILGEAGRGGSNVMAAAIHKQSGVVAVSRYRQKGASNYGSFCAELRMEQSTTRELSKHRFGRRHVQKLIQSRVHGDSHYAFYEPLCPCDLGTLLQREDYTDLERQVLFTQLLLAVRDLHAIHRIHSDIKPRNICVQTRVPLCLVLVDTASIQQCPDSGLRCTPGVGGGSVGYLAPEREGSSTYGKPADIWAAGCVGVEMLLKESSFTARYLSVRNQQSKLCNPWRALDTFADGQAPRAEDAERARSSFLRFRDWLGQHPADSKQHLLYQMLEPNPLKRITAHEAAKHRFAREKLDLASEASNVSQSGNKRLESAR